MFVSERIVFAELHKTGGTHIGRWLGRLVEGQQWGKHNRVPPALRDRFILGSIRNPWDWYVSLWAYGCDQKGSVHRQLTKRLGLDYYRNQLPAEMGKKRLTPREWLVQLASDIAKPVPAWLDVYRSSEDALAFRRWLAMLLAPERRFDMGEGFGFSPASRVGGLLSYRYLKLFTSLDQDLYNSPALGTFEGMRAACASQCLVRFFVRNEFLEDDLLEALAAAGVSLDPDAVNALEQSRGVRTNSSSRRDTRFYYDDVSAKLVAERERLVIERHGYSFAP